MELERLLQNDISPEDCLYAMFNCGSDPIYIEHIEDAEEICNFIKSKGIIREINKKSEDWLICLRRLDLEDCNPRHIYVAQNYNEESAEICFFEDYF